MTPVSVFDQLVGQAHITEILQGALKAAEGGEEDAESITDAVDVFFQRDARMVQRGDRRRFVLPAIGGGEAHAAEADRRNLEFAQFAVLHRRCSSSDCRDDIGRFDCAD